MRDIIARMRHDGCGGLAGKAELLSGIEGTSGRLVRRILLWGWTDGGALAGLVAPPHASGMFIVSEAEAVAIHAVFGQRWIQ